MRACVSDELVQVLKELPASSHDTLVSLLLLVSFQVSFEFRILDKVLLTVGTLVAGADDGLGPRPLLLGKRLMAKGPDLVGCHVLLDVGLLGEAAAADEALEGLLPGVRPHVLLQVEVLAEPLVAVAAKQLIDILLLLLTRFIS